MSERFTRLSPAARLLAILLGMVVIGTLLMWLPMCGNRRPLYFSEALFMSVSALSVTGLSVIVAGADLSIVGQIILGLLTQIGGIGYMVLAILVLKFLGRAISLGGRVTLQDDLGFLSMSGIVSLARQVLVTVIAIETVGAVFLWINWKDQFGSGVAAFYGVFHAVSAFCNAGLDLFGSAGIPQDPWTLAILGGLIFCGSIGMPVIFEVLSFFRVRRLSLHSRLTLVTVAILVFGGMIGIFLSESSSGILAGMPVGRQLGFALFQSIACRTGGIAGMPNFSEMHSSTAFLMSVLMFIGSSPASTGGGISTGTLSVLVLAMAAYARKQISPTIYGRSIPDETIRKASAVLTLSLIVVTIASWLLMVGNGFSVEEAVFEVTSAFATCGLSLNKTFDLNLFGQGVIIVVMFWGRLGALTVLLALSRAEVIRRVNYPEEKVLIG